MFEAFRQFRCAVAVCCDVDARILPSECEESYSFFMQHYYDTYSPGTDMFPAGDANAGVNGVFTADFVTAVAP